MRPEKKDKTVLIIAGPTAVGKTAVAIHAARQLNTEIISADSRQCYKELHIGVARPSAAELAAVPHHFIASHSIHEPVNAAGYEAYALDKLAGLFKKKDTVVMTGGTGLYIKAFCEGLDAIPAIPVEIRDRITASYETYGMNWLQQEVEQKDPLYFEKGENKNPQRLIRALEVIEATGQSILDFQRGSKTTRDFNIIKIALELPRDVLYNRINQRVDTMLQEGLEAEVRSLQPWQHLNALQTVGYAELFDYFNGKMTKEAAIDAIKTNTRRYAKRQLTWFKKEKETAWFEPGSVSLQEFIDRLS